MAFILADLNREVDNGTVTHRGPHHSDGGYRLMMEGPPSAISTWSGRSFDLCAPQTWTDTFYVEDIAHALSNICRFLGHVKFYSVAEHSLRVAAEVKAKGADAATQLMALHHDSTEAYLGDIPKPFKSLITVWGMKYSDYENYMMNSYLLPWLGLEYDNDKHAMIKAADTQLLLHEMSERPAPATHGHAMVPGVACEMFLLRHEQLVREIRGD